MSKSEKYLLTINGRDLAEMRAPKSARAIEKRHILELIGRAALAGRMQGPGTYYAILVAEDGSEIDYDSVFVPEQAGDKPKGEPGAEPETP